MGTSRAISPYGTWTSPISSSLVALAGMGSSALPREVHIDGQNIYWVVARPQEGGRYVILRLSDHENVDASHLRILMCAHVFMSMEGVLILSPMA